MDSSKADISFNKHKRVVPKTLIFLMCAVGNLKFTPGKRYDIIHASFDMNNLSYLIMLIKHFCGSVLCRCCLFLKVTLHKIRNKYKGQSRNSAFRKKTHGNAA